MRVWIVSAVFFSMAMFGGRQELDPGDLVESGDDRLSELRDLGPKEGST